MENENGNARNIRKIRMLYHNKVDPNLGKIWVSVGENPLFASQNPSNEYKNVYKTKTVLAGITVVALLAAIIPMSGVISYDAQAASAEKSYIRKRKNALYEPAAGKTNVFGPKESFHSSMTSSNVLMISAAAYP